MTDDFHDAFLRRWRELLLGAEERRPEPAWERMIERAFVAQSLVGRMVELSAEAWRELAPKLQAGEDWRAGIGAYAERVRRQLADAPTSAAEAAGELGTLWTRYLEHVQKLVPGFEAWSGPQPADPARSWGFLQEAYEAAFGGLSGSVGVGPGRDASDRLLKAFDAWVEWTRANAEYQQVVAETWVRAFERFVEELLQRSEEQGPPGTLRQLADLYMDVAEEVFVDRFRSDDYLRTQARVAKAGMEYWAREQEVVDGVLRLSHLPSRAELDAAHRNVYDLRNQVRELKRELRLLREELRREAPVAAREEDAS